MKALHRAGALALALCSVWGLSKVHAVERSWSYTYNSKGMLASVNGPRGDVNDVTAYRYDINGRLTQVINALGHVTQMSNFDDYGRPQTVVDPNNVITTLTYTDQGWLTSFSSAGITTNFEHDLTGQVVKVTRGDGSSLRYTWSSTGRLTGVSNDLGETVEYTYDLMGNRTTQRLRDTSGNLTQLQGWVYDELGRLLQSVGAAGHANQYGYDVNGNVSLNITPKQDSTVSNYDALNRLVSSSDPYNGVTRLGYDPQDNLTQVIDPRGVSTQYQYDGMGNLIYVLSPDTGATSYAHDSAGNVITKTDSRGLVTNYRYDALNRLTAKDYGASPQFNVQYHYDMTANGNHGVGRLTAVQDASGVLGYRYDSHGNLVEQIRSLAVAGGNKYDKLEYTYDSANQLKRMGYPNGVAVEYRRNAAGQVVAVDIAAGNAAPVAFASNISYLPFGPLDGLTWGNGLSLSRSYDQDYRLVSQQAGPWRADYGYDANSNIGNLLSGFFGDVHYSYDALDRLTREDRAGWFLEYGYDAVGNRVSKGITVLNNGSQSNSVTALSYAGDSNRLSQIDDRAVASDAAGNLTQDRANRELEYDIQGRLRNVKINGSVAAEYRYNAIGQRTHKITADATTTFLYGFDGQLIGETKYASEGVKVSSQYYLWLDNMPLGGVRLNFNTGGAVIDKVVFYLHVDHLDTPRLATNQAGQEIWRWSSHAFGEGAAVGVQNSGLDAINLRFPGQYFDSESGLHYNYFRDYDPQTGRYVESDPIGLAGGLNTYGYVMGNPLYWSDRYGLEAWDYDGKGNTSICAYYDQKAQENPNCSYYKEAAQICKGENKIVNAATLIGLTAAYTTGRTDKSQSEVYNDIRSGLASRDQVARDSGSIDGNGCTCGDEIDNYHRNVFDQSGINPIFYGGNPWPQNTSPNPVPYDPSGSDPVDDAFNDPIKFFK